MVFNELTHTLGSKKLTFAIRGFRDSVGMKYHNIAWLQGNAPFVKGDLFENPQRKPGEFDFSATSVFVEQRLRLSRVRDAQFAASFLPRRETDRHEPPFNSPLANDLIHLTQ